MALLFKSTLFHLFGMSAPTVAAASLLLHFANTCLAFTTATLLVSTVQYHSFQAPSKGRRQQGSENVQEAMAISSLIFATHPLRAEVVAWCSAQPYLLACFFVLVGINLHLHLRGIEAPVANILLPSSLTTACFKALSVAAFFCAILSKAAVISCVICPLAVDMLLLWHRQKREPKFFDGFVPTVKTTILLLLEHSILILLAIWATTLATHASDEGDVPRLVLGWSETCCRACYALVFYLVKGIWPLGLCPLYYVPPKLTFADPKFAIACGITAGLTALSGTTLVVELCGFRRVAKGRLMLAASWLLYIALLSPTLGIMSSHVCMMGADRYIYPTALILGVPFIGSILSHANLRSSRRSKIRLPVVILIVGAMSVESQQVARCWGSSESLWWRVVRVNPYQKGFRAAELPAGQVSENLFNLSSPAEP